MGLKWLMGLRWLVGLKWLMGLGLQRGLDVRLRRQRRHIHPDALTEREVVSQIISRRLMAHSPVA